MGVIALRVVYIVSVWPEPKTSGASTRVLQLIDCLQRAGFQLTIASTARQSALSADLTSLDLKTQPIKLNHPSFDDFIKETHPDIVIFDKFITEEQFGWRVATSCPHAMRVLDTIELHLLSAARKVQCKTPNEPLNLYNSIALREIAAMYRSDLSLCVSDYEIDLLKKAFQVPNDLLYYHPLTVNKVHNTSIKPLSERRGFIAIGTFLHPPNWDAVLTLKTKLWPAIRRELPNTTLNIIGSYPMLKATALHNPKEGFIVKGFVPDAFDAMQASSVHLAPLRMGAGVKSKCLLAFRAGTPTVTTPIGAEGLIPSHHWAGHICQDHTAFVKSAVTLYQDEEAFISAQMKGLEILQHFNVKKWNPRLLAALQKVKADLSSHRARNFTGKMMLHHQHLSTRYMAKWIEAKNQSQLAHS